MSDEQQSKDESAAKGQAGWAQTEEPTKKHLTGKPGYIIVSDNFGKAVNVKVDDINQKVEDVVLPDGNRLKGTLRITGRTPLR